MQTQMDNADEDLDIARKCLRALPLIKEFQSWHMAIEKVQSDNVKVQSKYDLFARTVLTKFLTKQTFYTKFHFLIALVANLVKVARNLKNYLNILCRNLAKCVKVLSLSNLS